jgi:UDP-glucose 4-epimerase
MSKILITGGAGYIGSQTNLCLLEKGFETVVFDNLVYGHKEVVPESQKCQFIQGDLLNLSDLEAVFEKNKIEVVVHFAAFAYVGESVVNPAKYYQNNVLGSFNLLETMRKFGCQKLVFSSTCATYGEPEILPITENEKQKPINPYGWSKLMIEQMIKDYHTAYGLNAVVFRYFNAAGGDCDLRTGENHNPETHLIPLVLKVAKGELDKIKVFGDDYETFDGTCIRDYIHTEDLAMAHFLGLSKLNSQNIKEVTQTSGQNSIQNSNKICEFINLASGNGYSVMEIIKMAEKITGKNIKVEIEKRRMGDPARLIANNSKARDFLGWDPINSTLENIIQTAWNWETKKLNLK